MSDEMPDPTSQSPIPSHQSDQVAGNAYGGDQVQDDAHTYQDTASN